MFKMNMKKALALLASVLILCTLIPLSAFLATADSTNLVINGDFENGNNGWNMASSATIVNTDTHAGNGALKLENPSAWGEAAIQIVNVDSNAEYTITWWSKRVSGNGAFDLFIMNNNGYANLDRVGNNWMNETSGNWVKNECVVKTGTATQVLLKWSCEVANAGVILVDDLSMTKVGGGTDTPPSTDAPVLDMDFEDGVAGFTPGSVVDDGSKCLKWTANGGWSATYKTVSGVEKNTDYVVTFKAKGSVAGAMGITIQNGDWGAFLNGPTFDVTTEWKEYTLNFNSAEYPNGGGSILFKFQDVGVAMDLYVDDLKIVKKGSDIPDAPDAPSNIIVNGDFENGSNGWNMATTATVIGDDTNNGSGALKLTNPTAWGEAATQIVTVEPNTEYILTWYTKRVSGNGAFNLFTMNNNGYANLQTVSGQNWMNETSGNWVKNEYVVNTGDATQVLLKWSCEAANAGILLIDDLSMTKVGGDEPVTPPATGDNLLINGDFEAAEIAPWDNLWGSNTVSFVAGRDSAQAIKVTAGEWTHVRQSVAVEPNTDYVLTVWGKDVTATTLLIKDGNDTTNVAQTGLQGGSDWAKTTLEFNSGSYTSIFVSFMGGEAGCGYTVDDAVLTKKGEEPVTPPVTSDNLIVNGDFETGDVAPWDNLWGSNTVEIVAGRDSTSALKATSAQWGHVRQLVNVEANTDYVITIWHKNTNNITLLVKDGGDSVNIAQGGMTSGDAWTKTTVEFNSGANTSVFVSIMGGEGGGQGIYDDISMTKKTGDTPDVPDVPDVPAYPTTLINGNFEDGTNGWNVNGSASITNDAHAGTGALKLDNPTAWSEAALQTISVQKNTNYVIKWYSKRVEGRGAFNLILMKEDNTNYSVSSGQNWMNEASGEWVKNEVVIATGDSDVLKFKFTTETGNPGVILIDDLTIVVEGSEPVDPTANMIQNGSFENGRDDWTWGGTTDRLENDYYEGKYSAKLSHDSAYGAALTQTVKVEKNTDYVIIFYTKRVSGKGAWDLFLMDADTVDITNVNIETNDQKWFDHDVVNQWVEQRVEFNSGDVTKVFVKFGPEAADSGVFLLDYVGMWVLGNEPSPDDPDNPVVPPPAAQMYMTSYGVLNNRPIDQDSNLLENPSFESNGGQWKDGFTDDTVSIVKDSTTDFGNKSLYFNTSGKDTETKLIFWMDVEPETDYVFSTWIKGAFLADDNSGLATIGVVNEYGVFLSNYSENDITRFLNGERQIVPTAWDNEWHLRGVEFNTGAATKVGIALAGTDSKMWIDDMALFKVGEGRKYMSDNAGGMVTLSYDIDSYTCLDKDSLIPDPNFTTKDESGFWADSYGWRNGFLTFEENEYEYGTSLKYTSTEGAPLSIIKTIKVKPDTDYTFSVDLKILQDGWGKLVLMDGKKREPINFLEVSFDSYDYDVKSAYYGWYTTVSKFNTDVYDEIAIAVVDDGGEVLLDNMRLYESTKGAEVTDKFIPLPEVEEPTEDDWYEDEWYEDEWPEDVTPDEEIIEDLPVDDDIIEEPVTPNEPVVEPKPVDNGSSFLWLIIGGSGLALAGVAVLIILLVAKKKKKAAPDAAAAAAAPEAAEEAAPEENA